MVRGTSLNSCKCPIGSDNSMVSILDEEAKHSISRVADPTGARIYDLKNSILLFLIFNLLAGCE